MLTYPEINRAMRAGGGGATGGVGAGFARFGGGQILCAPENDGGGGGGIAPAGGTHDQALINTINAAVSSQLERRLKAAVEGLPLQQLISQGIANALPTALEGVTTKMTETIGAQIAKLGPQAGGEPAGGQAGAGKGGKQAVENEAIVRLQSQMDEMKTKLDDKDRQLAAQAAEQQESNTLQAARAAFAKVGVKEPMIDAVIALHRQRGTFKVDKDGPHVMSKKKTSHGEYTERLDVEKFATEWAGSDEGKHYLPAPGARPRGSNGVDRVAGGGERVMRGNGAGDQGQAGNQGPSNREIGEALIGVLGADPVV